MGSGPNDEDSDDEEEERYGALAKRARELARAGRLPEALEAVRAVPLPRGYSGWAHGRTGVLVEIASALVESGARAEAARVLQEARQSCAAMEERTVWEAADEFHHIARLLEKVGARDEALATWLQAARIAQRSAPWDVECPKILAHVARDLAEIGELERAAEVSRGCPRRGCATAPGGTSPSGRAGPHRWTGFGQPSGSGGSGTARRRRRGSGTATWRLTPAVWRPRGGSPTRSGPLGQVPAPRGFSGWAWEKAWAQVELGSALLGAGAGERAVKVLWQARGTCEAMQEGALWEVAECLDRISQLLVEAGAREKAIATWMAAAREAQRGQHENYDCMRVLVQVAQHLADVGEAPGATEVARRIELDPIRDRALWYIAERARGGTPSPDIWPD